MIAAWDKYTYFCIAGSHDSPSVSSFVVDCDIGKLVKSQTDLHMLSPEDKYCILTTEPNSNTSSYPRTRPCASSAYRRFQPAWLKQHPWLHYSKHVDGAFCRACVFCSTSSEWK